MAQSKASSELGGGSKPPLCNKEKFANWKIRMQAYMDAIDEDLFETIINGPYVPTKLAPTTEEPNKVAAKLKAEWTDTEKKMVQLDKKAKNILFMSLEDELFENVVNCKTAKEVWETLLIMHEGTEEVRENKQSLLTQQYEMFTHIHGENITSTYERFNVLLNSLRAYGKTYPNKDLIIKFMRALPSKWDAKTTAIRESKNLHEMTVQMLYGNLLTYELEITQRAETLSEGRKKEKGIALKASEATHKAPEKEESDDEESNDENIAMFVRHFKKFFNKNSRSRKYGSRNKRQVSDECYNCKQPGHFIKDCPRLPRDELRKEKRNLNSKKELKGHHTFKKKDKSFVAESSWSDSDSSGESSDEEEPHKANLCLMAKEGKSKKEFNIDEVFDFYSPELTIDDLREGMHDSIIELHKYMKMFKVLSKDYSLLQQEKERAIIELETALQTVDTCNSLKTENTNLRQIIEISTQRESTLVCKIQELEKTITSWNKSSLSMDSLISSQRPCDNKSGLGFCISSSESTMDKSMETNNNSVSSLNKQIIFVKSSQTVEPSHSSSVSHSTKCIKSNSKSTFTSKPRRIVESRRINSTNQSGKDRRVDTHLIKPKNRKVVYKQKEYKPKGKSTSHFQSHIKSSYSPTHMHYIKCYTCHKYSLKVAEKTMIQRPKIRQIWVPKTTNKDGPKQVWVPK